MDGVKDGNIRPYYNNQEAGPRLQDQCIQFQSSRNTPYPTECFNVPRQCAIV